MKIWGGCGCLATNLIHLAVTKKSEKNPHNPQKIGEKYGIKFRKSDFWVQLWLCPFKGTTEWVRLVNQWLSEFKEMMSEWV